MKTALSVASRILRDCTPNTEIDASVKIQSELHGDMQSQAEMTWPAGLQCEARE